MGKLRQRAKSVFVDPKEKEKLFEEFKKQYDKEEEEQEEDEEIDDETDTLEKDFSEKDKDHLYQMFDILETHLPDTDAMTYKQRLSRVKWDTLPPEVSKEKVTTVLNKLRSHRNLREMIQAARVALTTGFFEPTTRRQRRTSNPFPVYVKDVHLKFREKYPTYSNQELMKLIGQKYNELSKEEQASYRLKADQLYFEKYGVYPSSPDKKVKPKIQVKLVQKKDIEKEYPEPKTPFDLWSNKKMLKGSMADLSELKAEWKCLDMKEKVKYILKAMKLAKDSDKSAISKQEKKILDEYEERPKYPATAFGEFWAEHKNMTMIQVAELWKNLPENEKNKRKEKFKINLREYKSNMQEFLDSLSKERLELEQAKKKRQKKAKSTRDSPEKKKVRDKSEEKFKSPKKKKKEKAQEVEASPEPVKKKRKSQKKESTPEPSPVISKKGSRKRKRPRSSDTEFDSDDQFEKSEVSKSFSKKRKIKEIPEDAETSETPQTPVNGQVESPTKKKKKKKEQKAQKMAPPEQPVSSVYDYFCKYVYTGAPEKIEKAWSKVTKSQKKEYFEIIRDLSQKYMEDLERYLKTLTPKEVEEYSRMKRKSMQTKTESDDENSSD
ncbi:nucleolar transcription factor 1-like [Phlebotomus papatasi]|uniref:nucleolar transcription factor 1-like n=1 Tax=Phlebotomus papatasi TaxID=29031 RepID=UPI0024846FF4|nr:nucleolar transcription factor 1-like [Phlebotomus papatasi]